MSLGVFMKFSLRVVCGISISSIAVSSNANLVTNGSFEATSAFPATDNYIPVTGATVIPGWASSYYGGEAVVRPKWLADGCVFCSPNFQEFTFSGPLPASSPDGGNFIFSDANFLNSPITQTISGLTINKVYNLKFYQALSQPLFASPGLGTPGAISAEWSVSFFGTQSGGILTANGATGSISPWSLQSLNFTATATSGVLSFLAIGGGDPPTIMLDGVSLQAVPEPGTWLMMLVGFLAVGGVYRRNRWRYVAA